MELIPEYLKLWEPYCEDGVVPLAKALAWLEKQAVNFRYDPECAQLAMIHVMNEIAAGKKFSTEGCDCGCEMTDPHTAVLHYMGQALKAYGAKLEENRSGAVNELFRGLVTRHVEESNRQDTEEWVKEEPKPGKMRRFGRFLTKPRLTPKHWRYK